MIDPKERVYIVCTGPSLTGFDFRKLDFEQTMVVNFAYREVNNWSILVAIDDVIYTSFDYSRSYQCAGAYAITVLRKASKIPDFLGPDKLPVIKMHRSMPVLDTRVFFVNTFGNSGYLAVLMAVKLGCRDIRILGMDITQPGHYYGGPNFVYDRLPAAMLQLQEQIKLQNRDVTISRFDIGTWEAFSENKHSLDKAFLTLKELQNYERS